MQENLYSEMITSMYPANGYVTVDPLFSSQDIIIAYLFDDDNIRLKTNIVSIDVLPRIIRKLSSK